METKKNEFIELKFTGRVKNGEIFDTNIEEDAKKINLGLNTKPTIICIGQEMVIHGFDNALSGKKIGEKYTIELKPKEAFKERKKELIKLVSKKIFTEKNIEPKSGMTLALDNILVRIASVSGGRVLVDFNNPLAGKDIVYDFTIKRKVEDINEKIQSILDFFIRQDIKFEIKDKKAVIEAEDFFEPLIGMLNNKFRGIIEVEFVLKEKEKK